jgi:hypothetical protein
MSALARYILKHKILPVFFIYNTPMQIGTDHVLLSLMTKNIFSKTNFTHHTIPKRSIGKWVSLVCFMTRNHAAIPKSIPVSYPNLGIKLDMIFNKGKNLIYY